MIDGVSSPGPAIRHPERLREGLRAHGHLVAAGIHPFEGKGAVRLRLVLATVAALIAKLDRDARKADLVLLELARLSSTRLEVPPHNAGDAAPKWLGDDRLDGALGNLVRADPREPELGHAAELQARRARSRCRLPVMSSVGTASGSLPAGLNVSWTAAIPRSRRRGRGHRVDDPPSSRLRRPRSPWA